MTPNKNKVNSKNHQSEMKQIKVDGDTHKALFELREYEESYNDTIKRLIAFFTDHQGEN